MFVIVNVSDDWTFQRRAIVKRWNKNRQKIVAVSRLSLCSITSHLHGLTAARCKTFFLVQSVEKTFWTSQLPDGEESNAIFYRFLIHDSIRWVFAIHQIGIKWKWRETRDSRVSRMINDCSFEVFIQHSSSFQNCDDFSSSQSECDEISNLHWVLVVAKNAKLTFRLRLLSIIICCLSAQLYKCQFSSPATFRWAEETPRKRRRKKVSRTFFHLLCVCHVRNWIYCLIKSK